MVVGGRSADVGVAYILAGVGESAPARSEGHVGGATGGLVFEVLGKGHSQVVALGAEGALGPLACAAGANRAEVERVDGVGVEVVEHQGGVVDGGGVVLCSGVGCIFVVQGAKICPREVGRVGGDAVGAHAGTGAGFVGQRQVVDIAVGVGAASRVAGAKGDDVARALVGRERQGEEHRGGAGSAGRVDRHEGVRVVGVGHDANLDGGHIAGRGGRKPEAHYHVLDVDRVEVDGGQGDTGVGVVG